MTYRIIELRQYTLRPGRRDDLVALFEREFIETQEAEGIDLIGQFLDLDDTDRFLRLPVRTDGPWLIWLAAAGSPAEAKAAADRLRFHPVLGPLRQRLRLVPTPRSRLRP